MMGFDPALLAAKIMQEAGVEPDCSCADQPCAAPTEISVGVLSEVER
jgi:hypothetical protein